MPATTAPAMTRTPTFAEPPLVPGLKAKPGIKKLNVGAVATATKSTRTEYPVLDDPSGDIGKLAEDILNESAQLEALEGSLAAKKAELRGLAVGQFFRLHAGKGEIPSSLAALTPEVADQPRREVLIALINKYPALADESAVAGILGEERTARFLRQKTTFKLDFDKVPEEAMEPLYEGVVALFAEHRASAALSAQQAIVPVKDFHTLRHTQLTTEENIAFDLACPIQAQVKTKGRGNK